MYYDDYLSVKSDDNCKNIDMHNKTFLVDDTKYTWDRSNNFLPMYDPDNPLRDVPYFEGRGNIGVLSFNLPMIFMEAKINNLNFFDYLNYYIEMCRNLHKRTKLFIEKKEKTINPFAFIYGGIRDNSSTKTLNTKSFSASFGITALNELQILYNGHTIREEYEKYLNSGKDYLDKSPEIKDYSNFSIDEPDDNIFFCLEVMRFINNKLDQLKREDKIGYSVYGTPAESLSGLQARKFRERFENYEHGLDKDIQYFSNSFHCHVGEDITVRQKQDYEDILYPYFAGGRISYGRYPLPYNIDGIRAFVQRDLRKGKYVGVNYTQSYCNTCGTAIHDIDVGGDAHVEGGVTKCPKCGSRALTTIERNIGYLSKTNAILYEEDANGYTGNVNASKLAEIKDRVSM